MKSHHEDIDMTGAQYITAKEVEAEAEAQSQFVRTYLRLGDEIVE